MYKNAQTVEHDAQSQSGANVLWVIVKSNLLQQYEITGEMNHCLSQLRRV
ncbi:hypothetical protein [Vibrio sinensis]|nr:hypothetical protein [Vibrio sinensis]